MVMVKPGLPYLDIVHRVNEAFDMPTFAFQVSGEYAMLHRRGANGWIDGDKARIETLTAFDECGRGRDLELFSPRRVARKKLNESLTRPARE